MPRLTGALSPWDQRLRCWMTSASITLHASQHVLSIHGKSYRLNLGMAWRFCGKPAYVGGELWFSGATCMFVSGGSGRFPPQDEEQLDKAIEHSAVARETGLDECVVKQADHPSADNRITELERIGFVLGLDELQMGYRPTGDADADLAVRLKTLRPPQPAGAPRLSPSAVLAFAHAASVIRVQYRLQRWLGIEGVSRQFEPTDDYGRESFPAYRVGYQLAEHARDRLELGDRPIDSMRDLVETRLGIPVVQARLPESIAGATIAVNDAGDEARGIVLNTVGANENVWVRRATLAHELGHLLFDPIQRLERVRVDTYQSNDIDPQGSTTDYVEQRANAFAISFLAPMDAVRDVAPIPVQNDSIPG